MCKKFIFSICLMLVIAVPASAYKGVIGQQGMTYYDNIELLVDIDSSGNTGPGYTQTGWQSWQMPSYWDTFGPVPKVFTLNSGDKVLVQMNGYVDGAGGNFGGSRNRYMGIDCTSDFELVYEDLAYIPMGSSGGLGMDYIQVDFDFGMVKAGETFEFTMFAYDKAFNYAGEPQDSKWAAYSEQNPRAWLQANGYPNGYPLNDMHEGLLATLLGRALMQGNETTMTAFDNRYGMSYSSSFEVTLDDVGQTTIYGWADMTSWTGSQHFAIDGFAISIPEPATVALLGLGGLALLRKRRT